MPGLWSARVDLLHAVADELAADVALPVAAGAELDADELLELELPHAAIRPAARDGSRTVESRRARSKPHNLHPGCSGLPGAAPKSASSLALGAPSLR
jgi:hypothetical protein